MDRPAPGLNDSGGRERDRPAAQVRSVSFAQAARRAAHAGAEGTLATHAWTVFEGRWIVLGTVIIAISAAIGYLFFATPSYAARSVVQVEQKRRTFAGLDDVSAALGESPPAEPEIEIIRSRMLIGAVVDQLQLDIAARPRTFPAIGEPIARRYKGPAPAPPHLHLTSWAWGGERIHVSRLEVPDELLEVPLRLSVEDGGKYRVADDEDRLLVEGIVGQPASGGEAGQSVGITVSEIVARPGTRFYVTKRNRERVIDELQLELRVQEKGRKSGIIVIELENRDPKLVVDVVNGISVAYLRQNVERRSAEASKTLEFLETQLPQLRSNVDAAESAFNTFRMNSGSVDTSAETKGMLDRAAALSKEIADAEVKRSELRQSFTDSHPTLVALANKLALLRSEQANLTGRMRSVPKAELNSARFSRELKDATDLYVALLSRAQELRVAKSGTVGDVRIIDRAPTPDKPSSPKTGVVLVLAVTLGLASGIAGAILRRSWVKRVETPDDVEEATALPVYVTVPHSDAQIELSRATRRKSRAVPALLAEAAPADLAIETMRSLRTSLQFALVESRNNVVALTGPAPGTGKSFIALNLAHVLAAAGRKVLLMDCDLRRGHLHRQFGFERQPGISDVVSGEATLPDAIRTARADLCLLPTGRIPPNPAEMLSSQRFEALLADASARFDLVIVDTPPLLAVTDAMLVARFAGVNLLVVRAGLHTSHELALAVKQFELGGIKLHGTVMNDVRATGRDRYGRGGYVHYAYTSESTE
jgi:tyrosine-protein kinase Etk/Wzc